MKTAMIQNLPTLTPPLSLPSHLREREKKACLFSGEGEEGVS
jgi:hypothetical protein